MADARDVAAAVERLLDAVHMACDTPDYDEVGVCRHCDLAQIAHDEKRVCAALAQARLDLECRDATLAMTVARLGGTVEGAPTHSGNYLQRLQELVTKELRCAGLELENAQILAAYNEARADLATAAAVTAQLQAELEAERHLGEVSQAEYSQAVTHAAARIKELQEQLDAAMRTLEAGGRVTYACGPEQMVVLKADYERLIASLPAGPRLVR